MPQVPGKMIVDGSVAEDKLTDTFVRADGANAFSADQSLGGNQVTNLGAGVAATDAVNKGQLDSAVTGLSWKEPARLATTEDITLSGLQTLDGIALDADDRVLVKDQDETCENGIFVAAAGAWTRAEDADVADELIAAAIFVREGSVNANIAFTQTSDNLPELDGSTCSSSSGGQEITWVQFTSTGGSGPGSGLYQDGANLSVGEGAGITVGANDIAFDATDADGNGLTGSGSVLAVEPNVTDGGGQPGLEVAVNGLRISTGAAGAGLSGGGGAALAVNATNGCEVTGDNVQLDLLASGGLKLTGTEVGVEPDDFAGTGLEDDGSDNLRLATQGNGIAGGAGSTLSVDTDGDSVSVSASGVKAGVQRVEQSNPSGNSSGSDDYDTGINLGALPAGNSYPQVFINGVAMDVATTAAGKGAAEVFFSPDGGTSGRDTADIASGDDLIFNPTVANFDIATTDLVEISYSAIL